VRETAKDYGRRISALRLETGVFQDRRTGRDSLPQPVQISFLLFALLFSAALAGQRLFYTLLFARLQVKGVTLHFFDNVFLLYLPLKAAQSVFERLAFLQSYFRQRNYTPKLVLVELVLYCNLAA